MASMNKVFLVGNLTRKPILRRTPKGTSVTDLLLALNREYITSSGKKQKEVCFVDVVVWGKLAEECVLRLDCSSSVVVVGHLQLDVWYSKEGEKRCKLRVYAEEVHFVDASFGKNIIDKRSEQICDQEMSEVCQDASLREDEIVFV